LENSLFVALVRKIPYQCAGSGGMSEAFERFGKKRR
jgi:hypothetical protein